MQELIDTEGVGVIIGAISSHVTLQIAPICEERGVVLLSPSASAPQISQAGDFVFRNYPSDILEGTAIAEFARDLGLERVVIFAMDNDFGRGLTEVFSGKYESKFRKVVQTFELQGDDTTGFTSLVAEAKKLDPDGIYIVSYVRELAELLKALKAANIKAMLLSSSSVTHDVAQLAGDAAELLVYPQPSFDPDSHDEDVSRFVEAYKAKYGEVPEIYAAHGYDALKLVKQAVENYGSTHPDSIKLGLASVRDFKGAAGRTSFDENGDVVRYPRLFVIFRGESTPYQQFVDDGGSLFSRHRS